MTSSVPAIELGATENLNGIACRYQGEAWVVGDTGTLLYTNDGGATWRRAVVPTNANLHTLATQDTGPVFVAGDGVFLTSNDTGAHWTSIATTSHFRSLAAAQEGETVLAVSDDGAVFGFEQRRAHAAATIPGATAVALSPDGQTAMSRATACRSRRTPATPGRRSRSTRSSRTSTSSTTRVTRSRSARTARSRGSTAASCRSSTSAPRTFTRSTSPTTATSTRAATRPVKAVRSCHPRRRREWTVGPNLGRTVLGVDRDRRRSPLVSPSCRAGPRSGCGARPAPTRRSFRRPSSRSTACAPASRAPARSAGTRARPRR